MTRTAESVDRLPSPALPGRAARFTASERTRRWAGPAWLLLVSVLLVTMHVAGYTKVGPVDELQHIDYLSRSPALVSPGDSVGQDAMREQSCRGIDAGHVSPPCSETAVYDPRAYQEIGLNTAAINTPLYYTVTKVFAAPLLLVPGLDSIVTAGRLVGALWMALGLLLAFAAGRRLNIDRAPLTALLTIFACVPMVLYPAATITPDAASFAAGAGVFLACLYWEEAPRRRWPILAAVAAVALLIKMTNVVILIAIGLYLVIRWVRAVVARRTGTTALEPAARSGYDADDPSAQPASTWVLGAVLVAVTTLVVAGGTLALQAALAYGPENAAPMSARFGVDTFPRGALIEQIGVFLYPFGGGGVVVGTYAIQMLTERFVGTLYVAGMVAAALFGSVTARVRSYAQALLLTVIVAGPVFVVIGYVGQGVYVPSPGRYAATLVPAAAVLTAGLVRTRESRWIVALMAAAVLLGALLRLASL